MFSDNELEIIINGYEKQASRMFKILILLLVSNIVFICLYFFVPSPINIDLAQNKKISSTQTVKK